MSRIISRTHYLLLPPLGFILFFAGMVDARANQIIETTGNVLAYVLPATAVGAILYFKDKEGILQFGESAVLTTGVTCGLKYTIHEDRPNGGKHSFPSMHASISFSSAEFIRKRYGWDYGMPAYIAATFVAFSRVESKQHYTYDAIAGAIIGLASSYLLATPFKGL